MGGSLILLLVLPLILFVTAAQVHLEPIWQETPPAIVAGHENLLIVLFIGIVVVFFDVIVAIVHLGTQKHFIEILGCLRDWPALSWGFLVFLNFPFLCASLNMDVK